MQFMLYANICFALNCQGTKKIQGMSLNMSEIEDAFSLESLVFKDMHNLWFLDFVTMGECKLHFPEELHFLPNTLRYFYWNCCPLKSFPPSFRPENLGELVIYGSNKIEQLWNADMVRLFYLHCSLYCVHSYGQRF